MVIACIVDAFDGEVRLDGWYGVGYSAGESVGSRFDRGVGPKSGIPVAQRSLINCISSGASESLRLFLSLGAEGVLPGKHIVSLLRVFEQFTHLIPSEQMLSSFKTYSPL